MIVPYSAAEGGIPTVAEWNEAELALLDSLYLFQGASVGTARRAALDPRCQRLERMKGESVYTPHHFSRSLGVVLSGRVRVTKGSLIVNVLGPGDLFGAAALFNDREDYAAALTARSDCTLLLLPQALVEELMEEEPVLARNYIRYLSGRIRFLEGKIDSLTAGNTDRKLAQYLLACRIGNRAMLDCSAIGLAARLHVSRASLYRALDTLTTQGIIRREGKIIYILDEVQLQNV